jgi:hypothetical protein
MEVFSINAGFRFRHSPLHNATRLKRKSMLRTEREYYPFLAFETDTGESCNSHPLDKTLQLFLVLGNTAAKYSSLNGNTVG